MNREIHHLPFADLPPVSRGQGIVNYPIVTKQNGAKKIHSGITRMPVGGVVPPHSHNAEEQVTVLKGQLRIVLDGTTYDCGPCDSTFISAGVVHEFSTLGAEEALVMVIYGNVNVNRTFTATGQTVDIGSDEDRFPAAEVSAAD